MFQPKLTLGGAAAAVLCVLLRMFLGSLLFAVWGNYTVLAWQAIPNPIVRAALGIVSLAGFLAAFAILMIAINLSLRKIRP